MGISKSSVGVNDAGSAKQTPYREYCMRACMQARALWRIESWHRVSCAVAAIDTLASDATVSGIL